MQWRPVCFNLKSAIIEKCPRNCVDIVHTIQYDSEMSIHFLAGKHKMHAFCVNRQESEWTNENCTYYTCICLVRIQSLISTICNLCNPHHTSLCQQSHSISLQVGTSTWFVNFLQLEESGLPTSSRSNYTEINMWKRPGDRNKAAHWQNLKQQNLRSQIYFLVLEF